VYRVNIAFTTFFQAPWRPPHVSNTIGERSTPIRPQESALSRYFNSSLSFKKVAALPLKGLPVTGFGWTIVRSTARSRLPFQAFNRMSAGLRPFPAISPRGHGELGTG